MASLWQQLPALLGVLVGALATFAITAATERSRWRRQQSVRWDDQRITAYTDYAHAVKRLISVAVRLAAERGVYQDDHALNPSYELSDLALAEEERTIKWEAVLMLGSDTVITAAREWHKSVFQLMRLATGQSCDIDWATAVIATGQARARFYTAAKKDIGVAVTGSAEAYEWQMGKYLIRTNQNAAPPQK